MYVMKRTDIVFKSEGENIRGIIENISLNKVLDLFTKDIINYRVHLIDKFYKVEKEEWEKIKEVYKRVVEKEIKQTKSYEITTVEGIFYNIDEDDYCSIVKKINLEDYDKDNKLKYNYYIETKSKDNLETEEYEISEKVFENIQNL